MAAKRGAPHNTEWGQPQDPPPVRGNQQPTMPPRDTGLGRAPESDPYRNGQNQAGRT